jgi:hypothetical protein
MNDTDCNVSVRGFISHLISLARMEDRAALAELRRLRRPGGPRFSSLRYIISFLPEEDDEMDAFVLVAGLFATHPVQAGGLSLGAAVGRIDGRSGSMDRRFQTLLDADYSSFHRSPGGSWNRFGLGGPFENRPQLGRP